MSTENDLAKGIVFKRESGESTEKARARIMLLAPWVPLATARVALYVAECNSGRMNVYVDRIEVAPRGMRRNIGLLRECGFTGRARGNGVYTLTRESAEHMAAKAEAEAEARKPENVRVFEVYAGDGVAVETSYRAALRIALLAFADENKKVESVVIVERNGNLAVMRRDTVRASIEVTFDGEGSR